jgi:hypothetical protein
MVRWAYQPYSQFNVLGFKFQFVVKGRDQHVLVGVSGHNDSPVCLFVLSHGGSGGETGDPLEYPRDAETIRHEERVEETR